VVDGSLYWCIMYYHTVLMWYYELCGSLSQPPATRSYTTKQRGAKVANKDKWLIIKFNCFKK
jgi:hypothetical protein